MAIEYVAPTNLDGMVPTALVETLLEAYGKKEYARGLADGKMSNDHSL